MTELELLTKRLSLLKDLHDLDIVELNMFREEKLKELRKEHEKEKKELEELNYIVFLLIGEEGLKVTKEIRKKARYCCDMWGLYADCVYIARKFLEYDKQNETISQYGNFITFAQEYEKEILNFLENNEAIEIKKGE